MPRLTHTASLVSLSSPALLVLSYSALPSPRPPSTSSSSSFSTHRYLVPLFISCIPAALSGICQEIALANQDMDIYWYQLWVAFFQFCLAAIVSPFSFLMQSPDMSIKDLPRNVYDGLLCWYGAVLCCAVWCCAVWCWAVLCYPVLCCAMQRVGCSVLVAACKCRTHRGPRSHSQQPLAQQHACIPSPPLVTPHTHTQAARYRNNHTALAPHNQPLALTPPCLVLPSSQVAL